MFEIKDHLHSANCRALSEAKELTDEDLMSSSREVLVDRIFSKYYVEPITFDWDNLFVESGSSIPPPERSSKILHIGNRTSDRRNTLDYHVPFTGDSRFLMHGAQEHATWARHLSIHPESNSMYFTVANQPETDDGIKEAHATAEALLAQWRNGATKIAQEINTSNQSLERNLAEAIDMQIEMARKRADRLRLLPVPIRKVSHLKRTLAAPRAPSSLVPVRRTPRPTDSSEWILDDDTYSSILSLIHDWGTVMERHPSTYTQKDEEALRDLFILLLTPHFQYTGGETFNRSGKTDILVRHNGANVFVAECKVWHSTTEIARAIDQLSSYLTWRDTKTALIVFVKTTKIEAVCKSITNAVASHPHYIQLRATRTNGWYDYDLRMAPSAERSFRCSVLLFHFPPAQGRLL